MARFVSSCASLLMLMAGHGVLFAQMPVVRLLTVFPPGGKAGAEFEVAVTGADLDEANQLRFSHAGISAKQKVAGTNGVPEPGKFIVTISTNVPPGVYETRVVGRFGISNPRSFVVGDLAEVIAPTTNTSRANASAVAVGTVINGRAEANQATFYKFTATKGQRILVHCKAGEIDSRMDAALVLFDTAGRELQRCRGSSLLDFSAERDGEYLLKVYDFLFRGGGEYFYRLGVSTGPQIDFVFPPSGSPGSKAKYMLYGRNLPGGALAKELSVNGRPLEQLEVEIELPAEPTTVHPLSSVQKPADATLDAFEYRLNTPHGASNPILVSYATGAVVREAPTNDQPSQAQMISPPCDVVGQFYPQGDQDWVAFDAKKGEVFWVEIFSQRLGLPTDAMALVQRVTKNDKGEEKTSDVKELFDTDSNIGGVEYKTTTRDPCGRVEIPEDGRYRVLVRDLFNRFQPDPRLVYRLSVRKEAPDFRLVVTAQAPPSPNKEAKEALLWTPLLRRSETIPIRVMAFRRDGFNDAIALKIENLPAGVSCNDAKIEKDQSSALLLLTATENAAGWSGPIRVIGKAKIGEKEISREARGAVVNWTVGDYNNDAIQSRLTRDFAFAVSGVESGPITVEPGENKTWEITEGGKLKIPLKLTRRAEFNANLKLKALGIAALDKLKEIEVDGKATNATLEIDLAEHKIPAGTHSCYLQTQTQGKYRNNPEAAKAAEEALKQAEKLVADLAAAVKSAPEIKQAATKTAAESAAKAKAAAEAVAGPAQAATEAEAQAKAATERLTAATTALDQKPGDPELLAAKESAAKAVEEAETKAKAALEAKSAAEKAAADAQAKAKADAEAQAAAEKAKAEAPIKLKEAEKNKELAATRAKETAKTAEPRDVTVTIYSAPINLKVTPALTTSAK